MKNKINSLYKKLLESSEAFNSELEEFLNTLTEKDIFENGSMLYMFFSCLEEENISDLTATIIKDIMDQLMLCIISLKNTQHLVEIKNNNGLNSGIFVDSLQKLQMPYSRMENLYISNNKLHFTEIIYRDINGLKFREVILPPETEYISGYELTNGLLMEREENLKLLFEEDDD